MTRQTRDPQPDGPDEPAEDPAVHDSPDRRASLVEFGLILALIAVVAILALVFLGDALAELMSTVGESVE